MVDLPTLYSLRSTFKTPSPVSSLALGPAGYFFAGSDDGSLRTYDLSTLKVVRAIRGLGSEISSVICCKAVGKELPHVWLACGQQALEFQMDSPKLILSPNDALSIVELGVNGDDVLNELALNSNNTQIAFSLDSGVVGVFDTSTKAITRMKINHENICGSVKFVTDRPREIVSGGYDHAILHFDYLQGKLLSRRNIPPYVSVGEMSLSPPFIMSLSVSVSGIIAAGTADGRLWIGMGGIKGSEGRSKKNRKWGGLREDKEMFLKVAEGPVVATAFSGPNLLTISTLLGRVTQYELTVEKQGDTNLKVRWECTTQDIEKVNALIVDDSKIIVGGLAKDAKGVIEVWSP